MEIFLRLVRLLAVVLWVGGICFFAFVLAPLAFRVLPTPHEAGQVVGGTLVILHRIGLICGGLFLVATLVLWNNRLARSRALFLFQSLLVVVMLALTSYLQFNVIPQMDRDQAAAGGDVALSAPDNPARLDFERLHPLSEKVEGVVLFAGLGIVIMMAAERRASDSFLS